MKKLEDAKKKYENIEIPSELKEIVDSEVRKMGKSKYSFIPKLVAGALVFVVVGVNVSSTFADAFSKIPFVGKIVSVISIHKQSVDNDKSINTNTPEIIAEDENTQEIADRVNKEIATIVDNYTKQAEKDIAEYKEAFISTGGSEEEFAEKNIKVDVSYDVKSESKEHLSLVLVANESWVNAYNQTYFYNINLSTGESITLKDILGDDYIEIANKSIKSQIESRMKEDSNIIFWGYGDDESMPGFETVTDDTNFYINENSNPVVVFAKYEIAPGFMGSVEFEIAKES